MKAIITGISGQDGIYLSHYLWGKGYQVYGWGGRDNIETRKKLEELGDSSQIRLYPGNLEEPETFAALISEVQPDEIYHLASLSSVDGSWKNPVATAAITGMAVVHILEAVCHFAPNARFFFACSSEVFSPDPDGRPCNEKTPFAPRNPYGAAKLFGYNMVKNYREHFGLFACNGLLFNHESPLRRVNFVTRKITLASVRITLGKQKELRLGDLDARRDWTFAGDIIDGMWRMLQHDTSEDYVLASSQLHTVRDICEIAFSHLGLKYDDWVIADPAFCRGPEKGLLWGDATKAKNALGWMPKTSFENMIKDMVDADMRREKDNSH